MALVHEPFTAAAPFIDDAAPCGGAPPRQGDRATVPAFGYEPCEDFGCTRRAGRHRKLVRTDRVPELRLRRHERHDDASGRRYGGTRSLHLRPHLDAGSKAGLRRHTRGDRRVHVPGRLRARSLERIAGGSGSTAVPAGNVRGAVALISRSTGARRLGRSGTRRHQGRRDRARARGGDRLRRARARLGAAPGAGLGAVRRQPHAGARGAAPPGGARARLVRGEPRLPRAHALARGDVGGVPAPRRAREPRHGRRRRADDRGGPRRSSRWPRSASRA